MFKYRAVNNLAVTQDLEIDDDLDVRRTVTCSTLQANSIVAGTIAPTNFTQADKLAISSPATGTIVYDTTAGSMSFYNGTNWYIPSWISFKSSGTATQGNIIWTSSVASTDARISRSSAVFTLTDSGVYQVCASATFAIRALLEPERSCQFRFFRSPSTVLASGNCQGAYLDSADSNTCCSISYNLVHTAGSTYYFDFRSFSDSTVDLSPDTHGFIARVQ